MPVLSLTNICEGDPLDFTVETSGLKYIYMKISNSFNILQMMAVASSHMLWILPYFQIFKEKKTEGGTA